MNKKRKFLEEVSKAFYFITPDKKIVEGEFKSENLFKFKQNDIFSQYRIDPKKISTLEHMGEIRFGDPFGNNNEHAYAVIYDWINGKKEYSFPRLANFFLFNDLSRYFPVINVSEFILSTFENSPTVQLQGINLDEVSQNYHHIKEIKREYAKKMGYDPNGIFRRKSLKQINLE
jgi:hypothetical protein